MILLSDNDRMATVNDTNVVQRIGNSIAGDITDTTKYLVITHTLPIASRDIHDLDVVKPDGSPVSIGPQGSGADLEVVRVSDLQTVIKCNNANLGTFLANDSSRQLVAYYNEQGDIILKWSFFGEFDSSYDIEMTDANGYTTTIAAALNTGNMGNHGLFVDGSSSAVGRAGSYFLQTIPSGLNIFETGVTFKVVAHKTTGGTVSASTEEVHSVGSAANGVSQVVSPQSGLPIQAPITSESVIDTPGGAPVNLVSGVESIEFNGVTLLPTDFNTYKSLPLGSGSLPKYAVYKLKQAYVVRYYSLDCTIHSTQAPTDWVLQGSNDNGSTWTDLDARNNMTDWSVPHLHYVENNGSYKWYRFKFTGTNNSTNALTIDETKLFGNLEGEGIGEMVVGSTFIVA